MVVKVIGALIAIWLAFVVLGVIFDLIKGLIWIAAIGGLVFLGVAAYGAIKGGGQNKQIRS